MRVMNMDPDLIRMCTSKTLASLLDEEDLKRFKLRHEATDVIIIDSNTDDIDKLSQPSSKVIRLINGLTKFNNEPEKIITVPIKILQGGYRHWLAQYPHFTTDPNFDPDSSINDFTAAPPPKVITTPVAPVITPPQTNHILKPVVENGVIASPTIRPSAPPQTPHTPSPMQPSPIYSPHQLPVDQPQSPRTAINKPVPTPPTRQQQPQQVPSAPKPNIVKNAPGTAVPVSPLLSLRPVLPRSHSSPNVAQADGDELDNSSSQLDNLFISKENTPATNVNNNHIIPTAPLSAKPRFDRTLKPSFNFEAINLIKAQLNFGRSPEASGKAITGLQNLGNTCFMNSVLQCLAYAPTLTSYFCSDSYYNHINFNSQYGSKGELAVEFGALVEKLNAHRHRYIEPKSFRDSVTKHIGFAGNEQQDSHEFMMMLFDKLHHDLNIHAKDKFKQNGVVNPQHANGNNNDDSNINIPRATLAYQFWRKHLDMNKSVISDLFEGIFMSTLTCTYCKGQSNTFEVFNCLSLPIPSESRCHIRDCLNHFSNPERIEAAWECPRCKTKREADKKIVICKLPKILIIHLKRFSLDGRWRQKLQTTVDFPLNDLMVDCTNVLPQSAYGSVPSKSSYNLYAVVNHYGHLDGGHYTAFCKLGNQRWYTFDDSNVTEMKDSDVCGQSGYLLFYQIAYGSVNQ